ncbi:MAG TPA: S4 domain-containing protein, partial [Paraburkholderia sp.]
MTRSNTPGAATGAGNSNKDYSVSADPSDALGVDSLDDDLGSDALAAAGSPATVPTVESRVADESPRSVVVPDELAGERLDKVLARIFPEFSRNRLQSWIEAERVRIDGKPAKIRQPVPLGATIELVPDLLPEQLAFTPEPVPLEVV